MSKLPVLPRKHRICVICEGYEEHLYFRRLMELNVWNPIYVFIPVNAKGESNIFARYQDIYSRDSYELVLIFCDTDKSPYREFSMLKKKLNGFFDKRLAAQKIVLWANPCSMQIILSHYGAVNLINQGKKTNAGIIEEMTGVKDYDGHESQIKDICSHIYNRSYSEMKDRLREDDYNEQKSGSSNAVHFMELFEKEDTKWISEINKYLEKED